MVTKTALEQTILASGLWQGNRRSSHSFLISPSVYKITSTQQAQLERIGIALQDTLAGLSRLAVIASTQHLRWNKAWTLIGQVIKTGVPNTYHTIQANKPTATPFICKVDLLEDEAGNYKIAEIDGHNKHGLGYSTLAARLARVAVPNALRFPGVAQVIAKEITKRSTTQELIMLYGDQERFYLPEMEIFQQEMLGFGVDLILISELEVQESNGRLELPGKKSNQKLLVDFPFLFRKPELNNLLANAYLSGGIDFLIPPKPFLGSKALLALVCNESRDTDLEAILTSQINRHSLETIREFIPETHLVSKGLELPELKDADYVLKESVSSGMKGTIFTQDKSYTTALRAGKKSYGRFILQREIKNRSQEFQFFNGSDDPQTDTWFMRVTAHFARGRVADVVVTARRDKKVHGAPDCLQLGAILT